MRTFYSCLKTTILVVLIASFSSVFAGPPTWTRVDYTNSTAFVGWVRINHYDATFPKTIQVGDYIGAFVNGECRMIAQVFNYNGNLYVSAVIHGGDIFDGTPSDDPTVSNTAEEIEFRVWDNTANVEITTTVKGTVFSDPGGEILDYEIGKPNTNSNLASLAVSGVSLSPAFSTATTSYSVEIPAVGSLPILADYTTAATDSRATITVTPATDFAGNNVTTIRVTAEDGTFTDYIITYTQAPCTVSQPTVTSPVEYCVGDVASALSATGTGLTWYSTASSDDGSTVVPTPTTTTAGTTSYFVSQTDGCESARARIDVIVYANPVVSITPSATDVCDDATVSLTLVPATGGTLSGNGTSGLSFSPATAGGGSHTITYAYTDNNTCSNSATTTIVVTEKSLPIVTTTLFELEVGADAPLLSATGSGTLTWFDQANTQVGTGNTYQTTINTSIEGTSTFTVTNTNGTCQSNPVTITIVVSGCSTGIPTVVSPVEYCVGDVASALSATGTGLTWYSTASSDDGSTVAPTPTTTAAGTTSYFVSQTDGCESARAQIDVIVKASPTNPLVANPNRSICDGAPATTFTATISSGATVAWRNASQTIVSSTPTFATSTAGTYTVTQSVDGCTSAAQQVSLAVLAVPAEPVVSNVTTCQGVSTPITSSVVSRWYNNESDATPFNTALSYTPTVTAVGTYTYYVSQYANSCESDKVAVTYTITENPTITVANVVVVDGNPVPDFTATTAVENTVNWYAQDQTTLVHTGTTFATGQSGVGTYYYYVEAVRGTCTSGKQLISLQITNCGLAQPTITATQSTVCIGQTNPVFTASATGTVNWYSDAALSNLVGTGTTFQPTNTTVGSYTYYATQTNGCVSPSTSISFTIAALPAVEIFAPTSIQQTANPVTITVTPIGGTLSISGNTGLTGNTFDPSAVAPGPYTLTYVYQDANTCQNSATRQIQVTAVELTDRTQLGDTIVRAENIYNLYATSNEFSQTAKTELQNAITVAKFYYNNYESYTNADLLEQTTILSNAIKAFLDARTSSVDVSGLIAKIEEAQQELTNNLYRQGNNVGQIPESAFTALQNAIDNANSYVLIPPSTQDVVAVQIAILNTAIEDFLNSVIQQPSLISISVQDDIVNLIQNDVFNPVVIYNPTGATGSIMWQSSNSSIASVIAGTGQVTAVAKGNAQITGTLISDPTITTSYIVQVSGIPEIVSISLIGIANQIAIEFSENMLPPTSDIYNDLVIGGINPPLYTFSLVELDPTNSRRYIITLGTVIDKPEEVTLVYSGTSIQSVAGAPIAGFSRGIDGVITSVSEIDMQVFVYPTVAQHTIYLEGVENAESIIVISSLGQKVLTVKPEGNNKVEIDISGLAQGTYSVSISNKSQIITAVFIKK